jgi:hypothetical protein
VTIDQDKSGKSLKPILLIKGVKQSGWDSKTKSGSFKDNAKDPTKTFSIKLNEQEIGAMISVIENYGRKFSAYHAFQDDKTQISLSPYKKKDGSEAFSFSVLRNGSDKFGVGIEIGEAFAMREFFKVHLRSSFIYSQ